MRTIELKRVWPEYWSTHGVTEPELARIAYFADDADHAQSIWENESYWTDQVNPALYAGKWYPVPSDSAQSRAIDIYYKGIELGSLLSVDNGSSWYPSGSLDDELDNPIGEDSELSDHCYSLVKWICAIEAYFDCEFAPTLD